MCRGTSCNWLVLPPPQQACWHAIDFSSGKLHLCQGWIRLTSAPTHRLMLCPCLQLYLDLYFVKNTWKHVYGYDSYVCLGTSPVSFLLGWKTSQHACGHLERLSPQPRLTDTPTGHPQCLLSLPSLLVSLQKPCWCWTEAGWHVAPVWSTSSMQLGLSAVFPWEVMSRRLFMTALTAFLLPCRYSLYFPSHSLPLFWKHLNLFWMVII